MVEENEKIPILKRVARQKAILESQNKFRKRINLKVNQIKQSMNGKVKDIQIIPTGIGRHQTGGILAILKNLIS